MPRTHAPNCFVSQLHPDPVSSMIKFNHAEPILYLLTFFAVAFLASATGAPLDGYALPAVHYLRENFSLEVPNQPTDAELRLFKEVLLRDSAGSQLAGSLAFAVIPQVDQETIVRLERLLNSEFPDVAGAAEFALSQVKSTDVNRAKTVLAKSGNDFAKAFALHRLSHLLSSQEILELTTPMLNSPTDDFLRGELIFVHAIKCGGNFQPTASDRIVAPNSLGALLTILAALTPGRSSIDVHNTRFYMVTAIESAAKAQNREDAEKLHRIYASQSGKKKTQNDQT